MEKASSIVNFNVGGCQYSVFREDLQKYAGSLLQQFADQNCPDEEFIFIARDGLLFRYVNAFLVNGHLPRDRNGNLTLDGSILAQLCSEAEFYGLPILRDECNANQTDSLVTHLPHYLAMKKVIHRMSSIQHKEPLRVEHKRSQSPLIQALRDICIPAFMASHQRTGCSKLLHNEQWTVDELFQVAKTDNPNLGEGDSFSIEAALLHPSACENLVRNAQRSLYKCFLGAQVKLVPVKLCVDPAAAPARVCTPTLEQSEEQKIGTLIVLLNSDFSGGDIHIGSDSKRAEQVPRGKNYIAIHEDCSYKMDTVTSGSRVTLLFDIVCTSCQHPSVYDNDDAIWYIEDDWLSSYLCYRTTAPVKAGQRVLAEVQKELHCTQYLVLALLYVYSAPESAQPFLKGCDRALYDVLSAHYDVQVVSAVVLHQEAPRFEHEETQDRVEAAIFTPELANLYVSEQPTTSIRRRETQVRGGKLFLSHELREEHVMHFQKNAEYCLQDHEAVYLMSGLRVAKKQ